MHSLYIVNNCFATIKSSAITLLITITFFNNMLSHKRLSLLERVFHGFDLIFAVFPFLCVRSSNERIMQYRVPLTFSSDQPESFFLDFLSIILSATYRLRFLSHLCEIWHT